MTAIQHPRPQHRSGAGARSMEALTAALRALRHVIDEHEVEVGAHGHLAPAQLSEAQHRHGGAGNAPVRCRELVLDERRIGLTPLEFAVMHYLTEREGAAVSRAELLADVWGYDYDGGSNVVDVVVRSLRKKLGERAALIEAVRGTGYRLRAGEEEHRC